jgi:hypothetical protein
MEIDGHPTQDLIEELEQRGSIRVDGTSAGPSPDAVRFVAERTGEVTGFWLFVPPQTYFTGVDEVPPV